MSSQVKKRKAVADEARALADSANEKHQYFCDFCRKDISGVVRIRCAECKDFDLCLECFAVGVEVEPHKNGHRYRVMYHVTTPIFDEGWGADEELLLLEAIETYGFGNWVDIAEHIGTKTKEECERHYEDIYLSNGGDPPLPSLDTPIKPKAPPPPSSKGAQSDYTSGKPEHKSGSASSLLGYLPKRHDFDSEWENEAEKNIADMEFKPTDTHTERVLKLEMIRMYNLVLDGRAERKQFIFERRLLNNKQERRKGKDDRELQSKLQMFARYLPHEEYDKFQEGMLAEAHLRKEIAKFQNYIKNGIRTEQEKEAFDYERKKRAKAASSSTIGLNSKRKGHHHQDIGARDLLSAEEKEKVQELNIPVPLYLSLKHALIMKDVQLSFASQMDRLEESHKQAKKKTKTMRLMSQMRPKMETPAVLSQIDPHRLSLVESFLRSKGVLSIPK